LIYIDYIAGAHGNYLEYVCNTFMAGVRSAGSPFSQTGAAHSKDYKDAKVFNVWQHLGGSYATLINQRVIAVTFDHNDLLPLQAVSMLRAGNLDVDTLEIDTYTKLNTPSYRHQIQQLQQLYFQDTRLEGYQFIRSPSWPEVSTIKEFDALPNAIKNECEQLHGLVKLDFSTQHPDCPRWILRDFFKHGFLDPANHGMVQEDCRRRATYQDNNTVYEFPYSSFYNIDQFEIELEKLANWAGFDFDNNTEFVWIHQQFTQRQHYAIIKQQCDDLVAQITAGESMTLPHVNLLMESYIEACLEKHYKKLLPTGRNSWFTHSQQIHQVVQ
jgi:hypothetical protein